MFDNICSVVGSLLVIAGEWMILEKMGEKGWKALVPFYSEYLLFKHAWSTKMFYVSLIVNVIGIGGCALAVSGIAEIPMAIVGLAGCVTSLVFGAVMFFKLATSFGHGKLYTIGMILAQPIFTLMLGFGKSQYKEA